MDLEMPYGWRLDGIPEIRRPLVRAFTRKDKAEWYDAEWLVSGPDFSGTLKPSGKKDWRFYLKTANPVYVVADYDEAANIWTVRANGITITLAATDDGANTTAGTALWRAREVKDASGNDITYCYDSDGRIQNIAYGGNTVTGEEALITIAFAYGDNTVTRTNAQAGFVTHYDKHIEKITVKSGTDGECAEEETGSGKVLSQNTVTNVAATIEKSSGTNPDALSDAVLTTGAAELKPTSISPSTQSASQTIAVATSSGFETMDAGSPDNDDDNENRLYAYDIVTTVTDSLDLFIRLEREGMTSRNADVIAQFEYSAYDDSATAARTLTNAPASLGESRTEDSGTGDSFSWTTKALIDFNRDGVPDVVDASAEDVATSKEWEVTSRSVNHELRTFDWNAADTVTTIGSATDLTTTDEYDPIASDPDGPPYNPAYTSLQMLDFDGDGYLDVVKSGSATSWTVSYGTGDVDGDYFAAVTETPPTEADWTYAQEAWRLKAEHDDADEVTTDVLYGLLDFNGDGWQDLVRPADGAVWLHQGERGGGWDVKLGLSNKFDGMRKVAYTIAVNHIDILDEDEFCGLAKIMIQQGPEGDMECADTHVGCASHDECIMMLGGVESEIYQITHTDESGAFYDMNGDSLPDYVSSASTPWRVYLNTGSDLGSSATDAESVSWPAPVQYTRRVDEGTPYVDYVDSSVDYRGQANGSPTQVYQGLVDVDGDGLVDLAITRMADINGNGRTDGNEVAKFNVWYKNTGAGFETSSRDLPAWWPEALTSSWSTTSVMSDTGDADGMVTTSDMITDLDNDGMVDAVSIVWNYEAKSGEVVAGTNAISYGPYPKPYLLAKVKNGQGGSTEVSYRSGATVTPAGDWNKEQKLPVVKVLADVIETTDALTGERAETSFSYGNGEYEDGVFHGFADRTVAWELNGQWTGKTAYEYGLDRDFEPLAEKIESYGDFNLSFGAAIKRGETPSEGLRYKIKNTYGDYGATASLRLVKRRRVTEYGESSGSASAVLTYGWDDYGNLATYNHNGGDNTADAITVTMSYVSDSASAPMFFRMGEKTVNGTDPIGGGKRDISSEVYYYDAHTDAGASLEKGLLTRTETRAGWTNSGEELNASSLVVVYERGERGEISLATEEATGTKLKQTFGFGGAVLATQTNGLGQKLTRTIDSQGRVSSIKDDNGLVLSFTHDAFNRVTKKTVTGSDGAVKTLMTASYSRDAAPYYDKTSFYGDAAVDETSYTVLDGFGKPAEFWLQNADGHFLVTEEIYDLRGLATGTSHPKDKGAVQWARIPRSRSRATFCAS